MTPSQKCIDLIKNFEGLRTEAYLCPAGVPTIGYGHTGPDVQMGKQITEQQAEELLQADLRKFAARLNPVIDHNQLKLNQNQYDALVSLAYNIGVGAFKDSTLLRLLKAGETDRAADEFLRWNKVAGKPLSGLTKRRQAERELFLS